MAGMQAALVELDAFEVAILQKIVHSKTLGTSLQDRARIVLLAGEGLTDRLLAAEVVKRGIVKSISHVWIWNFLKDKRTETASKSILAQCED